MTIFPSCPLSTETMLQQKCSSGLRAASPRGPWSSLAAITAARWFVWPQQCPSIISPAALALTPHPCCTDFVCVRSCGCNYLRQWDCTYATPKELNKVKLFTGAQGH